MNGKNQSLTTAKTLKHIVACFLLFLLGDLGSSVAFDLIFRVIHLPSEVNYALRALGGLALTVALFYCYTTKALHSRMKAFRITAAIKGWGIALAVGLPVAVLLGFMAVGGAAANPMAPAQKILVVISSFMMALKAGLLEEMLFRGYIMKLLESRWGKGVAILLPSVLFSLAHIPSMEFFSVGGILLLVLSGTLVGAMFSLLTYKGDSISNGVLLHTVWNFVLVTDIFHITTAEGAYGQPLFSVVIPSGNMLLTGAGFGMEASALAIVGYAVVVCWLIAGAKRKH